MLSMDVFLVLTDDDNQCWGSLSLNIDKAMDSAGVELDAVAAGSGGEVENSAPFRVHRYTVHGESRDDLIAALRGFTDTAWSSIDPAELVDEWFEANDAKCEAAMLRNMREEQEDKVFRNWSDGETP